MPTNSTKRSAWRYLNQKKRYIRLRNKVASLSMTKMVYYKRLPQSLCSFAMTECSEKKRFSEKKDDSPSEV